jgi:hypothetical protein
MTLIFLSVGLLALVFAGFFRGAPYVPTHNRQIGVALDLLDLPAGSVVVDLGSGDGSFLIAAAKRGLVAHGYEINPILCLIAWLRCLKYRGLTHIYLRDFWLSTLPIDTEGIYVFLNGAFMDRLNKKLEGVAKDHKKPIHLVSYGFALPNKKPILLKEGLYLYKL